MTESQEQEINFETSFARLEQILERMNSGKVTLDESLKLYEEADQLISTCSKRLNAAEERIEMLIKNRSGELQMNSLGQPLIQEFQPQE